MYTIDINDILDILHYVDIYKEDSDLPLKAVDCVRAARANGIKELPADIYELKAIFKNCDDTTFAYIVWKVLHLNYLVNIRSR